MHCAAAGGWEGNAQAVWLLLGVAGNEHSCNAANKQGSTPWDVARIRGHSQVMELLQEEGR